MPSHIFSRIGQWQDSIDTNVRSRAAADSDRDAYHAMDYMVCAYLQLARDSEALKWVEFVNTAQKPNAEARQIAYAAAAVAARYALERGDWAAASQLAELRAAMVTQKKDYWVEQAGIQAGAISARIARAEGRNDEALKLMRATADREDKTGEHIMMPGRVIPVREMLGELLLELDQPAPALAAFVQSQRMCSGSCSASPSARSGAKTSSSW